MVLVLIIISIILYFLPTTIANIRHKYNSKKIALLNLFLGWTVIAWVICLIWAFSKDQPTGTQLNKSPQTPNPAYATLNTTQTSDETVSSGTENNPGNATKFCPSCGSKVPSGTLICVNCGKPIHPDPIVLSGNKANSIRQDEVPLAEFSNVVCERKDIGRQKKIPTMILTDKRLIFLDKNENINTNDSFTFLVYDLSLGETLDKEYWINRIPSNAHWDEVRLASIEKGFLGGGAYLKLEAEMATAVRGYKEAAEQSSQGKYQGILSLTDKIYRGSWGLTARVSRRQYNIFLDETWLNPVYEIISSKVNPA